MAKRIGWGKRIGIVVMVFYLLIGLTVLAWNLREGTLEVLFWQIYLPTFGVVYGIFASTDSWQKQTRSRWYRPEMDDRHPEAQQAAINNLRNGGDHHGSRVEDHHEVRQPVIQQGG